METHHQFLRYAAVGLISNAALYGGYLLLTWAGMEPKSAMTVLYAVGIAQTYIFNRRWTFRHEGGISGSAARYVTAYALGYVFTIGAMYVLVDRLALPHRPVALGVIVAAACLIFLLQKFWVFPARPPLTAAGQGRS